MKFFSPYLALVLFAVLFPLQSVHAAETCTCSAHYRKTISLLTTADFLCAFTGLGGGQISEGREITWKHTFGTRLVVTPSIISTDWDEIALIQAGTEQEECETEGSGFQKIAKKKIENGCWKDGGNDCATLKISCFYQNK